MDDTVSRAEALNLVKDVCDAILSRCGSHYDGEDEVYDDLLEVDAILNCNKEIRTALKHLPSAQQWIPTSEGLPKTEEKVLVTCEYLDIYGKPHRYVCKAYHVDRYTVLADFDYWDEGCDEYCEEDDQYYVLEGWYEYIHNWGDYSSVRITEDNVLAWCPLLEPWKGEDDG